MEPQDPNPGVLALKKVQEAATSDHDPSSFPGSLGVFNWEERPIWTGIVLGSREQNKLYN